MSLINQIFQNHYNYYKNVGLETIQQQAGQVEQVSADYQGRVIYELLQNAFDKADKNILAEVKGNSLFIANDGTKFTYNANYEYNDGDKNRMDFQSLCSISTSTKTNANTIGNKGVGFKSVFSVAREGFVNVYTQGKVHDQGDLRPENIHFRIYDSFNDPENIPSELDDEIKNKLKTRIDKVQEERPNRGVPGYYFPILIKDTSEILTNYFKQGFVTVIEIPFEGLDKIQPLFDEIKKIHFNFVSLKYPDKSFDIKFHLNGDSFPKQVEADPGRFFYAEIKDEAIKELAEKADVKIGDNNQVAICIKNKPDGLFYNYLPTKEKSPFPYIDFHADFHTSVDRKSIDFESNSEIGEYNSALLKACIELYLFVLNSYLPDDKKADISINTIDTNSINAALQQFNWNLIEVGDAYKTFQYVRDVLKIWNTGQNHFSYKVASIFLSSIAKQYFSSIRSVEVHQVFFKNSLVFIEYFARDHGQQRSWNDLFKKEFAKQLLHNEVQVIPSLQRQKGKEILFKKASDKGEKEVTLPDFIDVAITSFEIGDEHIQRALNINDFSNNYTILKYFRQVSRNGEVSKDPLKEQDQIELLRSLYNIFERKTESITSFAHRYLLFLKEDIKGIYSPQNISNFSVSTVFLKTTKGKYLPAQLCCKEELDTQFLESISAGDNLDEFLLFLGVSPFSGHKVVDDKIYEQLKEGLDYIPIPYHQQDRENLRKDSIIPSIRVLTKNNSMHPALINYNRYPFLSDISNTKLRKQLYPLRIGDYDAFPSQYAKILFDQLEKNTKKYPQEVFRFYSANAFHLFHNQSKYLIVNNGKYLWSTKQNFKIARNRNDFDLLKKQPLNVLCFFNGKEVPDQLKNHLIDISTKGVEINNEQDITSDFKSELEPLIPFILIELSYLNASISEKDYINNLEQVSEFQSKWNQLSIIQGDKLSVVLEYQKEEEHIKLEQSHSYHETSLYLDNSISKSQQAHAIAKHIFNVGSLSAKIELILFHKKSEELREEYNSNEVELITSRWLPNYDEKFQTFQSEILRQLGISDYTDHWYVYNESNRSEILIRLEKQEKINQLIQVVSDLRVKEEYLGYFDHFRIQIDRSHIESKASELILLLEKNHSVSEYISQLKALSKRLGIEEELDKLEDKIYKEYPELEPSKIHEKEKMDKEAELKRNNRIDNIYSQFNSKDEKQVEDFQCEGDVKTVPIPAKKKKIVFKGNTAENTEHLETLGATGEEEVLIYFINQFIKIPNPNDRKNGIELVYALLQKKIGDDTHEVYKEACLKAISDNDDNALKKALIPFFYVTMHYKFAYFDLIVYHENKATLVEVKTTNKNKKFYLSIAEVDAARNFDNYLLVRNTADGIYFLGNPIKDVEDKITGISGDNFSLKPRGYEFSVNNNVTKS